MNDHPLCYPQVNQAIVSRHSFRAFTKEPVDQAQITRILNVARFSPSSTNMQPWQVAVVIGEKKRALDQLLLNAFDQNTPASPELSAYLKDWFEPYKSRRFACGTGLYEVIQIAKEDRAARVAQTRKNFEAFGAPAVLIFYMHKDLNEGSIFDMGMFYQSVMLAALAEGLETCPEASLIAYPDLLRNFLDLPQEARMLSGMALGHGDYQAPVNQFRTSREEVQAFARFYE